MTSTKVSLSEGGHQEVIVAVSESVGTKDVGHPVQGGSNLRLFTRDLIMVTISVISWSPDMSPDDVAHARVRSPVTCHITYSCGSKS